jgi:Ca2+-binding RTX toxin-like protein
MRWKFSALLTTAVLVSLLPHTQIAAQVLEEDLCFGLEPTIRGTEGDDVILGTPGQDVILGRAGDDLIHARGGFDVVCAGEGDDEVIGGPGLDFLVGDLGADSLQGGPGADFLFDVDPNDSQTLPFLARPKDESRDVMYGDAGPDFLWSEGGDDILDGGKGKDFVVALGIYSPVTIDLSSGFMVSSYTGMDTLSRIENAFGTFYADTIIGDEGPNLLGGTFGEDRVYGGDGEDLLYSSIDGASLHGGRDQAADTVWVSLQEEARVDLTTRTVRSLRHEEDRPDQIFDFENVIATPFDDVVVGDERPNVLGGTGGSDRLLGGGGDDVLLGDGPDYIRRLFKPGRRGGRDFLEGGGGDDTAHGGPMKDGCVNVEKKLSCESEQEPPQSECPDSDPLCDLPIPPQLMERDTLGILRALVVTDPDVTQAELRWIARMMSPVL